MFDKKCREVFTMSLPYTGDLVINDFGTIIDYDGAINIMDDDIREDLCGRTYPDYSQRFQDAKELVDISLAEEHKWHGELTDNQEFFFAYCDAHEKQFGEPFEPAKKNPCW